MTTTYIGPLTLADAQGMSDEGLAATITFLEDAIAGKFGELTDVDATISNHLLLTTEARTRRTTAPKEAIMIDRATAHVGCTHPRTKVARAACRRARARAAQGIVAYSLVKSPEQVYAAFVKIAAKGCQATVKSGARAGQRCGRTNLVHDHVVCSGHARSFKIAD